MPLVSALRIWPKPIGQQCLLMLVLGLALGLLLPDRTGWLAPLASLFLQASQIVVMPYLICELLLGFGHLPAGSLGHLIRLGGVVLVGQWLLAALVVVALPLFLPPLVSSEFFQPDLLTPQQAPDLLRTYLPDNIFSALANDNFPAVVLFSCLMGFFLNGIEERELLLGPLAVLRQVLSRLNKLVVRLVPFGIFALVSLNVAHLDTSQLIKIEGFFVLAATAFLLLSLLAVVSIVALTPLDLRRLWRMVAAPLLLTVCSANLMIALPMLVDNLQQELPAALPPPADRPGAGSQSEELAPLISLGYALPGLGQVAALIFVPFAAWYADRAMEWPMTLRMLATALPASVSGIKAVSRQELIHLGLPLELLQLVHISGEWFYRFEKLLSFEGLVVLAVLVYARSVGAWRLRPLFGSAAVCGSLLLALSLGWSARLSLAAALRGSYRNNERLMALTTIRPGAAPTLRHTLPPAAGVSLAAIRHRGVLRVGLRSDSLPWAYVNRSGELVGFDIDLLRSLAANMGLRLELWSGPISRLDRWLAAGRLDLLAGGIQLTPGRASRHELSDGYLPVHLALVVPDSKVRLLQPGNRLVAGQPIRLAVHDSSSISASLEEQIGSQLGGVGRRPSVRLIPVDSKTGFFRTGQFSGQDGLLIPAEAGAAWAVMYPRTSLITPFQGRLTSELVLVIGGRDPALVRFINTFLAREKGLGRIEELYNHWILLRRPAAAAANP